MEGHGLQASSIGFLIDIDTPMVWRGPMVTQALEQLLKDTNWRDLDYLVVDLPPGTGDIQLTLAQKVPVTGAVIVTTPQDIALIDARKGLKMFEKVGIPILGVVENMSFHTCPKCGHESHIFGSGGAAAHGEGLQHRAPRPAAARRVDPQPGRFGQADGGVGPRRPDRRDLPQDRAPLRGEDRRAAARHDVQVPEHRRPEHLSGLDSAVDLEARFSHDYADARARLLAACALLRGRHRAYPNPHRGPRGEELATDIAWFGPKEAAKVLVLVSATHGVEGFCGSGAQLDWLLGPGGSELAADTALLVVHAINPHGFAWLRRVTEEGCDLNRNFVDFAKPLPTNAGYDELAAEWLPPQLQGPEYEQAESRIREYRSKTRREGVYGGALGRASGNMRTGFSMAARRRHGRAAPWKRSSRTKSSPRGVASR